MESWTEICVVRRVSREDGGDGNRVPILVDAVFMDGRQRWGDSGDDIDADKDPFWSDLLPGGLDGQIWFGRAVVFLLQQK